MCDACVYACAQLGRALRLCLFALACFIIQAMRCALLEAELRGTAAAKADAQATPHDTWHTSQRDACDLYFIPFFTLWIQARLLDSEAAAADALARAQTLLQQLDEVRPAPRRCTRDWAIAIRSADFA